MQRYFAFFLLPLLCAATPAPSLSSNLFDIHDAWNIRDNNLGKMVRVDARLITKTVAHRTDAESCQSTTDLKMYLALYSCLPLLKIFEAFEPLRINIMTRHYLNDADSSVSKAFDEKSGKFFAMASERKYPAGDVAIVHAHIIRSLVFESRKSYTEAMKELDAAVRIIETTRITERKFDISALLLERKTLLEKKL